jgi:hypothetical protein
VEDILRRDQGEGYGQPPTITGDLIYGIAGALRQEVCVQFQSMHILHGLTMPYIYARFFTSFICRSTLAV